MPFFKNRRNVIIVSVVAAVVLVGGALGGLYYVRRKQLTFLMDFSRTINGILVLARTDGATALTDDQVSSLLKIFRPLEVEDTIPVKDAKQVLADVKSVLTADQQAALKSNTNLRGLLGGGGFQPPTNGGQPGAAPGGGQPGAAPGGGQSGGGQRRSGGSAFGGGGFRTGGGLGGGQGGILGFARLLLPGSSRLNTAISGQMFTRAINALEARQNGTNGTTPGQTEGQVQSQTQ